MKSNIQCPIRREKRRGRSQRPYPNREADDEVAALLYIVLSSSRFSLSTTLSLMSIFVTPIALMVGYLMPLDTMALTEIRPTHLGLS
jgi:hypothetical protein